MKRVCAGERKKNNGDGMVDEERKHKEAVWRCSSDGEGIEGGYRKGAKGRTEEKGRKRKETGKANGDDE